MRIASNSQRIHSAPRSSAPAPEDSQAGSPLNATPVASRRAAALSESVVAGLVGLMDALIVTVVGIGYYWFSVGWNPDNYQIYVAAVAINVGMTIGAFQYARLYDFDTIVAWPSRMRRVVLWSGMVFLLLVALAFALKISGQFSRLWLFSSFVSSAFLICMFRGLFKFVMRKKARAGQMLRNVAIVGVGGQARHLVARLNEQDVPWKRIVGIFDDRKTRIGNEVDGYPILGDLDDLVGYVRRGKINDVVITLPWSADERLVSIIARLRVLPVHVYLGSDLIGYHFPRHHRQLLEGVPVLEIASAPLSGWSGFVKLIEDKAMAVVLLILFAPLLLLIAVAIKLDSRGPVLFRQARYGFNNEVIVVYKFRTMYHDRPPDEGVPQAQRNDPRVTRVGRLLRRTSLDELPQLLNVLVGDMSMIGPRPHAVEHNEQYSALIGGYYGRHKVKPGITGWAQVNGLRGETESLDKMAARVEHDIHYIENWSVWFDLKIIMMTALLGWVHKNAF
jgi:Undecaprenyl-phosphate glucose phosphotransferase